ncbi:MAG: ATP-grasp domain-containing protein [Dehalococcoidia bacterium]
MKKSVLIAGVGGASLGTEIFKSLRHSGNYDIFAADISPYAYGLYEEGFIKTCVVDRQRYIPSILDICRREKIDAIVPGGEEPLLLLSGEKDVFERDGIVLAINSKQVIDLCADKIKTFDYLRHQGIPAPSTKVVSNIEELGDLSYPCIVKPATGSGGSTFVCLAEDKEEANLYISYLNKRGIKVVAQEYVPHCEGEYTVGVLSLPNGEIIGAIALKRSFSSKLSYLVKYNDRIVSSGYSQGLIDDFDDVRAQAEDIASKIESRGPLNIQGRLKDGVLYPFELNARFSASTYLRTMAGFNEVDMFLQFLFERKHTLPENIKYGYYLRSLEEKYIGCKEIKR